MEKKRKSIRLKNYDYSQQGLYFVTICSQNREYLFGSVQKSTMILNINGKIIESIIQTLSKCFPIELDTYQIMPNHIHAIIMIKPQNVGVSFMKPDISFMKPEIKMKIAKSNCHMGLINQNTGLINQNTGLINQTPTYTLGHVIRYFKSKCTYEIHKNGFNTKIWQRNYYEHIIRNETDLYKIQKYIKTNPKTWERDRNNKNI